MLRSGKSGNKYCLLLCGAAASALLVMSASAHADERGAIVTDRPDYVESSDVVGRGRVQIETSALYERNRAAGVKDRVVSTPTLLRVGAGDAWELRVETDGRMVLHSTDTATGAKSTQTGYADASLGVKWHVHDAAGTRPSVGILAHVDLDSGSKAFRGDGLRPSLRASAEWELPHDLALGVMPGIAYDKDAAGERFVGASFGIVLGKAWTERFRTFVEIAAPQIARSKHGGSVVTLDLGAAYLLSDSLQVDTALLRGLNDNTADIAWTIGLSARF